MNTEKDFIVVVNELLQEKLFLKNDITEFNDELEGLSFDIEIILEKIRSENLILNYGKDIDKKKLTKEIEKTIKLHEKARLQTNFLIHLINYT